jgi:predicted enzyme related to lactoylglutathione lyase
MQHPAPVLQPALPPREAPAAAGRPEERLGAQGPERPERHLEAHGPERLEPHPDTESPDPANPTVEIGHADRAADAPHSGLEHPGEGTGQPSQAADSHPGSAYRMAEAGHPYPSHQPTDERHPHLPSPSAEERDHEVTESRATPTTRASGRPMPSPRRTPPTESAAHPYSSPTAEEQVVLAEGMIAHPNYGGLREHASRNGSDAAGRPGPPHAPAGPGRGRTGDQFSGPRAVRRAETVGVAKVPAFRPLLPGLQLQPMVHVGDMAAAVAFYEKLGGEVNHGDRDGEWVLMQVGTSQIGLVTRPPDASRGESTVELNFTATMPLDRLEQMLRLQGVTVVEVAADRDLGTRLHVETPDGMPIKIHQVEPDLMV